MAPQAPSFADANVLPELWETVNDIDKFISHESEVFQASLYETLDSLTACSPSYNKSHDNTPSMSILGIFTRAEKPREDELPEDPPLSACAKDQVMCRRRMTETAMFVPEKGLVGTYFYHTYAMTNEESNDEKEQSNDKEEQCNVEEKKEEPRILEERTVLLQAVEHYQKLRNEPTLSKYFENEDETSATFQEDILKNPRFGEQIMTRGMDASQIAIGDIFEVEGGLSPLKIEVATPRLCCAYLDKRNGSVYGMAGVKHYCNIHGLGGVFARVLVAGELSDDMRLIRTAHPNPKWTMAHVSKALYGEGPKQSLMKKWAHWSRDKDELKELCELEAFGRYEWRDEAKYILDNWEEYHPEDQQASSNAVSVLKTNDLLLSVLNSFRINSHFGESTFYQILQQYYNATMQQVDHLTEYLVNQV